MSKDSYYELIMIKMKNSDKLIRILLLIILKRMETRYAIGKLPDNGLCRTKVTASEQLV